MCSSSVENPNRQVLPTNVKPTHYDLTLQPDLETFEFHGQVIINLNVNKDTNTIVLNTREIEISSAVLSSEGLKTESKQSAISITHDDKKDEATLTFAESIPANLKAVLDISFVGHLNDKMAGFYRSSYKDSEGNTQYLATTQFESTDARRAFPCWDEPALKATFDVTLVVPSQLVALSNMDVISEKPYQDTGKLTGKTEGKTEGSTVAKKSLKEVKYSTTPLMSTYLLAFCVGEFDHIESFTSGEHNGKPIRARVYTLPGVVEQGRHALNVCTNALEYFAQVFGEPYPLPKIDMVAIPDFEAGAMENWGLITYRTVALLFDEKSSSISFRKSTAYTVCHELAHQWFGNLVTMEWWDHLWLNEGFATWVGWLAVDNIFPEWDVWTSFVNEDMPRALSLDALRTSHPIEVAVNDPAEIHQIFDAISYYKGASVIRMLSSWLGVETFLAGVRRYIQRYKLANASTDDLWKALSEEAGQDVSEFMTLWTKRVGYPVLNIQPEGSDSIKITQSRYLSTGDLNEDEDNTVWWAPLGVLPDNKKKYTLTEKSQTFPIAASSLYKLNAGQTAVYRVNYPIETIRALGEDIKKGKDSILSNTSDRVGLLADAGALCVSGEQTTAAFLELARAFVNEENYFVWSQLSLHLSNILSVWYKQPKDIRDGLKSLRRDLFAPIAHKLGWEFAESDDYLTNMLRVLAIANAGNSYDDETTKEAKERFWKLADGNTDAIHPNLRGPVFNIMLNTAAENEQEEEKVWEQILKIYRDETYPTDQRLIALSSLGHVKGETLIKRFLGMTLEENEIRNQDTIYVFGSLSSNSDARELLWEFFTTNYTVLHEKYGKSLNLFASMVRSSVKEFVCFEKIKAIEDFFAKKDTKEYARVLQQALEGCRVNAKWVERDHEVVADWVRKNYA